MFRLEGYPLDEYIMVEDDKVVFPERIRIALAVCSRDCNTIDEIVESSCV